MSALETLEQFRDVCIQLTNVVPGWFLAGFPSFVDVSM